MEPHNQVQVPKQEASSFCEQFLQICPPSWRVFLWRNHMTFILILAAFAAGIYAGLSKDKIVSWAKGLKAKIL